MPQMDMSISKSKTQIQDEENPVHDIKWSLKNFHDYVISNYSLKVRLDGLNGELLYDETFPPNIRYFLMEGMTSGRVYYVEVNALSALGLPLISVGTEYNPDESPDPLTVSQPLLPLTTTTVAATKKPVKLELHVRSLGDDELVMNWSLEDSNTKNDIAMFIIKAKDHEDEYLILDTWTDNETWEYKLKKVLDYRRYNFMVQAVDVNNNTLADAYETIDIPSGEDAAFSLPISTISSPMEPIELDLRLQSLRSNGTSMYWTLQDPDNRVQQFRITVQEMDENGDIVYDSLVKRDNQEYLVEQLEENGKYYFILEALDAFNNTLASDNETYIVSFSDDIQEDTTTTNGNFNENTATESAENNQEYKPDRISFMPCHLSSALHHCSALSPPSTLLVVTEENLEIDYYFTIQALDVENKILSSASAPYRVPDLNEDYTDLEETTPQNINHEYYLDLEIVPLGYNTTLNWKLIKGETTQIVCGLHLFVYRNQYGGETHINQTFLPTDNHITLYDLVPKEDYVIELNAVDCQTKVLAAVRYNYNQPPPDVEFEPIFVSSRTTTNGPLHQDGTNLFITQVETLNSTAIFVKWYDMLSLKGNTSSPASLRYAEFTKSQLIDFIYLKFPPNQTETIIINLKPGQSYMFQIAPWSENIEDDSWSKLVLKSTQAS
uniref:Fibronectin type-III domain-containing protein n=1 Tax=Biomphalaria glabrata TaxID=6526 RepID=A0A2C9K9P8_BIOGL